MDHMAFGPTPRKLKLKPEVKISMILMSAIAPGVFILDLYFNLMRIYDHWHFYGVTPSFWRFVVGYLKSHDVSDLTSDPGGYFPLLLLCLVLLGIAWLDAHKDKDLIANGEPVIGEVVKHLVAGWVNKRCQIRVRYEINGTSIEKDFSIYFYGRGFVFTYRRLEVLEDRFPLGSQLTVFYDPSNPHRSRLYELSAYVIPPVKDAA